jgi:hypothetical protein
MQRSLPGIAACLSVVALALTTARSDGQETPLPKDNGTVQPAVKADPAKVAKLIEDLGSKDFKTRAKASQELAKLEEVPEALREAAKHADAEVAGRAKAAIAIITARVEQKAFEVMVKDLHKVELDQFVRRMVTDQNFASEPQWKIIETIARAVIKEANKLSGRQILAPDFAVNAMPRLLLNGETKNPVGVGGTALLSTGATPYITSVSKCLVIVDGDFTGATGINDSLLIVRGNVGRVTSVSNSIILATGLWIGATACDNSFVQVNNHRIRFTVSRNSFLIKTLVKTTGDTNSQVLNPARGPLQLLKFSPRKTDDQLVWGKDVNNLAVAVTPADQKDKFLIRWKNVGNDVLELPWERMQSHGVGKNHDDLMGHIFLKGPDGKLAPARQQPAPPGGGPQFGGRSIVLGPGQSLDEVIDLWTYIERPAANGQYQLSIELDIPKERKGREWEVKTWSGKIQSNVLDVTLGK